MGLGLLGRGVGDARFLARMGAELLVTDMKNKEDLTESLEQLKDFGNITYRLGEHKEEDFEERDLILKGAGVPLASKHIVHARAHHVPVDMSASLFLRIAHIPSIGVTGTRGKSTVTMLIEKMLRTEGVHTLLGGNIKGVSNLSLFDSLEDESVGVFELDSWQCQGFDEKESLQVEGVTQGPFSPHIAVFTTFFQDHQNYYKNDPSQYLRDKANIFLHQNASDVFVVGRQALPTLEKFKKDIRAHVHIADESDVPRSWKLTLEGTHNRYNAGLAVVAARAYGVSEETIQETLETMEPIPGRLEKLGVFRGVSVYNDTNATTPEATVAALEALDTGSEKKILLIVGGADKELDMELLKDAITHHTRECIFLNGTGTASFLASYPLESESYIVNSLKEAVERAFERAREGDTILLSPAFASFGMFKNEYDRGEQFVKLVQTYA